jgi:hypothetical protein
MDPYTDAEFDCWADGGVRPMTSTATRYIVMAFLSKTELGANSETYSMKDKYGTCDIQDHLNSSFLLQDVDSVRGLEENQLVS